ncbi:cytochrome c biogenesis protein CcsA [Alkalicoccus luteus]|uniref:Cytochrome c biogenesis protein CcsA n=1 Tax=Alkalicoccus luteus TaxID=1237094 RepID=A0A969PPS3_9BACI|nr:cytochrome c biogenesis protein CcsA [Alkalicoccus luteus]NJP36734.1 cytochrome c biogenesis protein CcsA [Alkalicoccus luteus]
MSLLYVLILALYSISILGYFIDFMQNNQKVNRLAFWLLSIVWVLLGLLFAWRFIMFDRLPLMTAFEGMFVYAWMLVSLSLVLNRFVRMNVLMLLLNTIGFIMLAFSMAAPDAGVSEELNRVLITEFLVVHVILLLLSYAAFTISFAFSLIYLIQHRFLKQKKWLKWMQKFGSLSTLERNSYAASLIGVPLLLTGLILGIIWASITVGGVPWADWKVLTSFLVLGAYAVYLIQYQIFKRRGYNIALYNTAAFLLLLINYFLSGALSDFHIW